MAKDYQLYELSESEFESFAVRICIHWLGNGVVPFASGKDGGRDGKYYGTARNFPNDLDPLSGHIVLQAKHVAAPDKSCSDAEFARLLKKAELDHQRQRHLRVLRSTDAFDKFKELQREVTKQASNLVYLEQQRKKLAAVVATAAELREAERDRGRATDEIKAMIQRQAPVYERFSQIFNG